MKRLLLIDFRKYSHNRTFWTLGILYLVLMVFVFVVIQSFLNHAVINAGKNSSVAIPQFSLYSFPYVWHNLAYLAGFFKIFLALIVIIFVTNEFQYKTIRQNVMSGMSRTEFIGSKIIFAGMIALAATLILLLSGGILGLANTEKITFVSVFSQMQFVAAYFLEIFTFLLLALLFAFVLQKQGLAIGIFALYYYVLEPILGYRLPAHVARYLPVKSITHLIDVPNSALMKLFGVQFRTTISMADVVACFTYSLLFSVLIYLYLKNRDL
ncbi:hypothetical protein LA303_02655 [Candidatus Sulfidibacterium hydrothermale]|uniref:hypothetical protein n=1 Tax=Candidatus Sulfidibacterium hydrothermale TaxID=2875962 RepID=UPI001F0B3A78|nr:hypothetical protein [Candidatus Sulfidibacterium hydrothermale]UBM62889.1 hypothetical protein LA303_02655 [Candidatus Sulfidibacterium hydrothermale]